MLNLTNRECVAIIAKSNTRAIELASESLCVLGQIALLKKKQNEMEESIKTEQGKIVAAQEALILNKGIPKKVSRMRNSLLVKKNRVKREDITIAEQRRLDEEIEKLEEEIKHICNHPFVFHKEGYSGSSSDDYEDGYPSERYCVVCGLEERAKDFCQNGRVDMVGSVFETLKSSEDRVVQDEPFRQFPKKFSRDEIWVPLGAVLMLFEKDVARILNGK